VVRAHVDVPSILSKTFDVEGKKLGYIAMSVFAKNTDAEFAEAYRKLADDKVAGLIIDLRYNPGGFLEAAVNILSNFTEKNKLLVRTESRDPKENIRYVSKGNAYADIPVVVLVDENSASASEILAGALQDYGIAAIVGTTSYGK
jgi:carboxyl-terminal processing protease